MTISTGTWRRRCENDPDGTHPEAKVGMGTSPSVRWLCLPCYDDELADLAAVIEKARGILHGH